MTLLVEQDVTPDPIHISLFRAIGIMPGTQGIAYLIKEFLPLPPLGTLRGRCPLRTLRVCCPLRCAPGMLRDARDDMGC